MKARVRSYEKILSLSISGATEDGWSTSARSGMMFCPAMTQFCGQVIEVEPHAGRPGIYQGTKVGFNWAEEWLEFQPTGVRWYSATKAALVASGCAAVGTITSDILSGRILFFILFMVGCVIPAFFWWKKHFDESDQSK